MRFSSRKRSGLNRGRFSLRKTALGSLLLAAPLLGALIINGAAPLSVSADGTSAPGTTIPAEEEALDDSILGLSVTSSTSTNISQSFRLTMTAKATTGYNNGMKQNNVYVVIDDANYKPSYKPGKGEDLPVYNAYVAWIDFSQKAETINIPQTVTSAGKFVLNVTAIAETACYTDDVIQEKTEKTGTAEDYGYGETKAKKIFVPSTIKRISKGAFAYFPENLSFEFEASALSPEFEDGWTDCPASRMAFNKTAKAKDINVSTSSNKPLGKTMGFIIGYYEKNEYYAPLLASFDIYKKTGELVEKGRVHAMHLKSSINPYDAIGGDVGKKTETLDVDVEMKEDEIVDPDSIVFHNIYLPIKVKTDTSVTFIPDLRTAYSLKAEVGKSVSNIGIDAFFATKANRVSTFMGHIEVDLDLIPTEDYYQVVNPTMYEQYEEEIKTGIYTPRVLLYGLRLAMYEVTLKDANGETVIVEGSTETPIDYVLLQNGKTNTIGFTISMDAIDQLNKKGSPKFTYENLVTVNILGFSVKTDLWINSSNNSLNKSDKVFRFAALSLLPDGKAGSNYINLLSTLLLSTAIYLGATILIAVGYYLYCKRRFRNDEFRRVNDKKYWIAATKNILGFGLVFLAVAFIVMRFAIMITTVVTFNPLDAFVIVFALAGGIFIGFAIKGLVVAIRNSMKRKNDAKLHLDKDKAEDGTR